MTSLLSLEGKTNLGPIGVEPDECLRSGVELSSNKRILITGGAGFAGAGLVERLLSKGHSVTVLDIKSPNETFDWTVLKQISYKWKSVTDIKTEDVYGHDIVIHLQAQADVPMGFISPRWTVEQNVLGVVNVLEACREMGIEKFIFAASGNEIGRPIYLPIDEKHPMTPHNPYGFSKAAAELACWAWYRCYGVPIIILANGMCCGKGMRRDIVVYKWLLNILHGEPVVLEGGAQTRDLTYVSDIIDAFNLVIDAPPSNVVGEKFQISYGKELSMKEILQLCFKVTGKQVPVIYKDYRPGEEGQRECFTNMKARNILGYVPKVFPEEGIRLTWEWIERGI